MITVRFPNGHAVQYNDGNYLETWEDGATIRMRDIIKIRELLNSGYTWQECFDYFKYVRWNKVRQNNVTAQAQILSAFADKDKKIAELEAQVAELKDFAIWMTGCGYDFCQHEYFIKQRDVLLKA